MKKNPKNRRSALDHVGPGPGRAILGSLPFRYISTKGRIRAPEAVEAWRASEGFEQRIGKIRELLEDVEVRTLDPVIELG